MTYINTVSNCTVVRRRTSRASAPALLASYFRDVPAVKFSQTNFPVCWVICNKHVGKSALISYSALVGIGCCGIMATVLVVVVHHVYLTVRYLSFGRTFGGVSGECTRGNRGTASCLDHAVRISDHVAVLRFRSQRKMKPVSEPRPEPLDRHLS